MFHIKDFLSIVGSIRNVDAITNFGRVNLLMLARNKESGDTNELEFRPQDIDSAAVSINDADAKEECFRYETKFHVYLYKPINENCPHPTVYILLLGHVGPYPIFRLMRRNNIRLSKQMAGGKNKLFTWLGTMNISPLLCKDVGRDQ